MRVFALAAALTIGSLAISTDAFARHGGGGGAHFGGAAHIGGGGARFIGSGPARFGGARFVGGPRFGTFRHGFRHHRFFRRGLAIGFYPYYAYDYGCYRLRHVLTPWGWRWRRVNVCYHPYY
jgi:hypothetical protein